MLEPGADPAGAPLPPLVVVDEVQRRLDAIFPASFPDRSLLVGRMAAHVVFVFLYGGFIEGRGRWLRPSLVYFFTAEQARRSANAQRQAWLQTAFKPGHRPSGKRWYADNSRESIRDDLMRGRLLAMGIIGRKEGVATTSSAPVYFLRTAFAALFDPALVGAALADAVAAWRSAHLTELPDLILADLADPVRFLFCEIVATDGPVTTARKAALTAIARRSGIDCEQLHFVTAFQDREAAAFRKAFSRIAPDSDIWFSTEPDLILELRSAKPKP